MQLGVRLEGVEAARRQLSDINRKVEPVMRGALNTTATRTRQTQYIKPIGALFYDKQSLRRRLVIKRAGRNRNDARIIPSSSGIPILQWPGWKYSAVSQTRGVIYIRTLRGRKIAAGFVNPSATKGHPLRSKGFKGAGGRKVKPALGPSIAYFFKQITNAGTIRWTNQFLQQEFEKRFQRELTRYR